MLRRHHSLVLTVFGTLMLGACGNSSLPAERVSAPGNGGNDAPVTEDRCGEHPWCDTSLSPAERSALVIDAMTTDEKIAFLAGDNLTGIAGFEGTHTGTSNGIERLGIPTVYYSDGPMGVRSGQGTAFPAPIALAATWDPDIAQRYGAAVATEAKFKGNDIVFAPTVNIMRVPHHGRTFEGYGEDPELAARIGVGWIRGAQRTGLIASVKHYVANNQEGIGLNPAIGPQLPLGVSVIGNRLFVDAVIDDRTLREIYLPAFEAAVTEANVGVVMCGYNRVNGEWACESETLLETILRDDWGFDGYVVADYLAAHNPINNFYGGLDFEPWPGLSYGPLQLTPLVAAGVLDTETLDRRVGNILRSYFAYGLLDRPAYPADEAQIDKQAHADLAGEVERGAITLLQNNGLLPLDARELSSVAIIGEPADNFQARAGSAGISPFFFNTPREVITARLEPETTVHYDDGSDPAAAAELAATVDVALVFVADRSVEGADRLCIRLNCVDEPGDQDALIAAVAAANARSVVVLETGAPVLTPWRNALAALVQAWIPGVDAGRAIDAVLFGDADPGGRLPVTFPESEADLPTAGDPTRYPGVAERAVYAEGLEVGYRWFDARGLEPAFPFGHGLSYTQFDYADLTVGARDDGGLDIAFQVLNTGTRAGVAVPQVYLSLPDVSDTVRQPPQALKAFDKLTLNAGEQRRVELSLPPRALEYWDTQTAQWARVPGCATVRVGRSSRDIVLTAPAACSG